MKNYSLSALVAAGLLAGGLATSANAADLGGNCCADLEERIAELEATTARKGNRKVSLTVSGWVAQQVTFWDDGFESNTYVHDVGTTLGSHVKFTGSAQISPGWTAGYVLQLEAVGSDGLAGTNQNRPDGPILGNSTVFGPAGAVRTLQSYWFVKSDQLGKVGVGLQSQASDNTAILVDGSGSLVPANFVAFDYAGFFTRRTDGGGPSNPGDFGSTWGGILGCTDCNGLPTNNVRYDSPTFGGFSLSATWGEDDFWDIAARYAGEHHGFKLAVAGAFSSTSSGSGNSTYLLQPADTDFWQVGGYIQHVATGLFLYSAYTDIESDDNGAAVDNSSWYIKPGLRTKFNHLGATVFYGEYQKFNQDARVKLFDYAQFGDALDVFGTFDGDLWGLGIVQEVDAAAMSVWIKYRNISGDANDVALGFGLPTNFDTDDFQYVGVGGLINF